MRRRAVIVRRPTEFDELMDRYSTRGQVEFVLKSRGRTLAHYARTHTPAHTHTSGGFRLLGRKMERWGGMRKKVGEGAKRMG